MAAVCERGLLDPRLGGLPLFIVPAQLDPVLLPPVAYDSLTVPLPASTCHCAFLLNQEVLAPGSHKQVLTLGSDLDAAG